TYTVDLCQNRTYDIYVEENGEKSGSVSATLDTNSISIAKLDKTFDINVVDIALTEVTGDVVVHDINNDGTSLDLSKVQLTFTADDNAALTYTTGITDNKLSVTMMPNHSYTITATGNDGYALSALSGSYLMAAGDTAPFKNILFTETLGEVAFSSTVEVGADKAYATVSDAITAIKAMTNRPAGEAGRVAVVIDPGTYVEQVIVDTPYVTLKAAYETNKPTITFYYGIGYLYYSSDGGYYSLDRAVQKTEVNIVARWGSTVRVAGANFIAENIIFENSLNCRVTPQELADGVTSAGPGWYGDVSGKPDRTVDGYDARKKEATERCAAFAGDAANYELYQCELIGSQDTLYTGNNGYFKDCYIEGGTDYIFGGNSVVFEGCTLAWHGYSDQAVGGYITACKTSDVPVPGTPNMNANGYLLKNCTITNSKYYTDNKFAAGSWGRNWGGANCQVVFDGITLDGVDTPGAWVKMGGELSASVLYVNDVTDKDGNAVNVSGTTYNPNGTMAANGYTVMDPTDYFGIWTPVHYTGEKQTPKPTADPGEKQTPKPTADPGEEQTPKPTDVPVTKLPANTSVVFDAGVTENEDGTKTGTSYTETAVFGNYVVVYADETHSIDIEASNKTINDTKYTARLKLGGKTTFTGEIPTERAISVTPAAAGTITIDFAHGSSSGDARTLTAYQNGAAIGSASATAGETATLTAAAAANMPVYILSVDGGINIYGINLTNSDDTVSCVKITATYGGNGALTDVAVENVTIPVSEAVPVTAGNVKTMYWESLESMKPITASSAPDEPDNTDEPDESEETVSPEAEANVIWKATAGVELQAGQVLAEGLSLVFGTDDTSKPVYTEFTVSADDLTPKAKIIGGVEFTGYVSSGANGSWSGTSIDPEKPTAIKYTAAADGILTVYLDTVASSKTICVGQDGMKKADIEAAGMIGPDAPVVLPVTVNAGSSYYIYVAGSKARFCGAAFEETVVKQIWRASSNDVGKTAGAELMPGLSIVADNSSTSANYVTAAVDPVWTEGVLSGAALKYTASANGTLTVSFVDLGNVDSVKTGVITDSEGNVIESYTTQGLAKESFDLSTEVTAGNIYYMYGQGTKARFSAVVFTPAAE
ncbi:MAG: pectinesterase family protein, partial [Candidatus Ornithomonoglobus sp.]